MEQLCLCSVMLNQFLLNSKLKLGFHSSDISDVYSKEKGHEAPKKVKYGWVVQNPILLTLPGLHLITLLSLTEFL